MKNEIYDSMLSRYDLTTEQNRRNAIFEDYIKVGKKADSIATLLKFLRR